jgi:transposase
VVKRYECFAGVKASIQLILCVVGFQLRHVVDIGITRRVTEYQLQILEDEQDTRCVADFPDGVNSAVQYGNSVKAHAV